MTLLERPSAITGTNTSVLGGSLCSPTASLVGTEVVWVPGCDNFSITFNTSDHFNRALVDKTFPHKPSSDLQALHDFLFSAALLNIFNLFIDSNGLPIYQTSYRTTMLTLADAVYTHGVNLL